MSGRPSTLTLWPRFALFFIFFGALVRPVVAAQAAPPPELAGFDEFVTATLRKWETPGASITIVKDGKVILAKGYGVRDLATGAPMTKETIFPIQSETKAFTAFTAMLLRDEGKLSLDAPISTYIPGFRMHDAVATLEVSIRDFLTHRSGLPSYGWLWLTNTQLDRRGAMERMPHLPSAHPFRSTYRYANLGYVATAHAIENVAGEPWERFTEKRILEPLGMTRTTFSREKAMADPNHISGSMWRGGRYIPVPMQGTTPLTNSTGGLYSTAEDMAKWILLQLGNGTYAQKEIIKPSSIAEMHRPYIPTDRVNIAVPGYVNVGYGLGWYVDVFRGEKLIEHGGGHWGVSSLVGFMPHRGLGVSIFVNQETDVPYPILFEILDRFMGAAKRDWPTEMLSWKKEGEAALAEAERNRERGRVAGTTPSHALPDYAGTYEHPGLGAVIVTVQGDTLVAQTNDDRTALAHWHYDVFVPTASEFGNLWAMLERMWAEPTKVQFVSNFDGQVSALRINATGEELMFTKNVTRDQ